MKFRYLADGEKEKLALFGSELFWQTYRNAPQLNKKYIRAYMARAFSTRQIGREIADENISFLIAEIKTKWAGYAKLVENSFHDSLSTKSTLEIERIYLDQNYWGRGFGKPFMDKCVSIAVEKEKEAVWLGVWKHNERAIKFYEKYGFENVGTVQFDLASSLQEDHVMEFKL